MKMIVTIDVEEEGLFRGRYETGDAPVENVSRLNLLSPLFRDLEIRPTLLVSYQVARHGSQRELLLRLKDEWGAQLGAHLHPWNTPPIVAQPCAEPVPSEWMPRDLLRAKLDTLLGTLDRMGISPLSFRMGRFNMGPKMLSVLDEAGISVDSSVAPLKHEYGGPSHILAPTDPYFPDSQDLCAPGDSTILEVPITIVPVVSGVRSLLEGVDRLPGPFSRRFSAAIQRLCLLPAQPFWTGLQRLKAAVRLHQKRGGQVVTIFFHSSELMPGGSPQQRTEKDVKSFLGKLADFLHWVQYSADAESRTLSEICGLYARNSTKG